jgi:hypothetical protein
MKSRMQPAVHHRFLIVCQQMDRVENLEAKPFNSELHPAWLQKQNCNLQRIIISILLYGVAKSRNARCQ